MRRIGVLMSTSGDDPEGQARNAAFLQGLQQLGWTVGRNLRIDYRWGASDSGRLRDLAAELVALAPDVIVATAGATVGALQQVSRTVPIVFVTTIDPVQAVAPSLGVEVSPVNLRDASEIERAIAAFARSANDGLIVTGTPSATAHRNLIITLAARHNFPRSLLSQLRCRGGLIYYGPDFLDQYRAAAGYVDRILKDEKPADLPVQAPTKYELVINLKTAKTLGLKFPTTLLARADEVIE